MSDSLAAHLMTSLTGADHAAFPGATMGPDRC